MCIYHHTPTLRQSRAHKTTYSPSPQRNHTQQFYIELAEGLVLSLMMMFSLAWSVNWEL